MHIIGAHRYLSESLGISRHLLVATAFHQNTSEMFGKSRIIVGVHSASLLYHFPVKLTRHITSTFASQHSSFSQVLIFFLTVCLGTISGLLIAVKG